VMRHRTDGARRRHGVGAGMPVAMHQERDGEERCE
jgi:hypothetical protein